MKALVGAFSRRLKRALVENCENDVHRCQNYETLVAPVDGNIMIVISGPRYGEARRGVAQCVVSILTQEPGSRSIT